ncbi:C2H2 type zinc finger domain-containing protein [Zymoseptoria brevis]|uniref:C2H2 type zinc finger domain-containing protein n=1 Tax=Zymoseptoria brevis TaxID=1047168 RepID=A0A0F4GTG2_9PEZI|nr:C2H2 type zinc finger domain-containing protein [Zymoseptoria brevis]
MATLVQTSAGQQGSAHPFTCNTCQVAFKSGDLQRTHMQSDWHRYNLKRRVASLPPLTSEIFAEKVLANKASAAATAARASFEKRCEPCDKTYYSEGAYVNHLGSQKHKLFVARYRGMDGAETESMADSTFTLGETLETASTVTETDPAAEEDFDEVVEAVKQTKIEEAPAPAARPQNSAPSSASQSNQSVANGDAAEDDDDYEHKADVKQCLFCNYLSPTMDLNVNHMSRQHGCFIPEQDYLVDLAGLINYLSETVIVLHQCLYCHKQMHTDTGVQTHMRDRGHCMIAYATEDEQMDIGEFYDFSSTYSDDESEEDEDLPGGVSLGAKRAAKTTVQNENGEDVEMHGDDEGWESDASSLSSVPTDEITSVPIDKDHKYAQLGLHRHHSHADPRPHKNSDGFHSHAHQGSRAAYHDDYELHLPSGRTAGHRSLKQYYRQNLRNYPSAEERQQQRMIEQGRHHSDDEDAEEETERNGRGRQVVSRADGGMGMIGVSEAKKREVKALEKRLQKQQRKAEADYQWGNNRRGNFQKHFRDHLLQ